MKPTATPTGLGMLIFAIFAAIIVGICLMFISCSVSCAPDGSVSLSIDAVQAARAVRVYEFSK